MLLLQNPIQPYAWGTTDGLAALVGTDPTGGPEAELWVGTHPAAPSRVVDDAEGRTLAEVVASDPERWLGTDLASAGHTALPFLLKVLAVGSPLSLQAHPSVEQARAGFAREEAARVPVDAPNRSYRDDGPKPEALVALAPTWALCGFRPPADAAELLGGLAIPELDPLVDRVRHRGDEGLAAAMSWLLRLEGPARTGVAGAVAASVPQPAGRNRDDPRTWVHHLSQTYPGDPTALAPLLLNVVRLDPGAAVHLPAGNLHAYLEGAGVEIMAASDNVLRGGLTPKHIDVDELLSVLRFEPGVPAAPTVTELGNGVTTYDAGEDAFALGLVDAGDGSVEVVASAPSLFLPTGGPVTLTASGASLTVGHGAAAYLPPGADPVAVSGPGRAWWATTGGGLPR